MADETYTREIVSVTHTNITEEDRVLSAEFGRVARKALVRMESILDYGPLDAQLAVGRSFIGAIAKLASIDSKSEVETHRVAFQDLLHSMTVIDEVVPVVTPSAIQETHTHAASPATSLRPTDD